MYGEIYPPIWPDEVLFFSAANNLKSLGILKTDVLEGIIYGMDQATLWIPPLYLIVLSISFFLFGESLIVGRSLSLVLSILVLGIFYKLLLRVTKDKKISLFFIFLLSIEYSFLRCGNIMRMEILNLVFVLTTLYFLETKQIFLSGICLGLSALTHPISVFMILVTFVYFQKLKELIKIAIVAFLVMIPWLLYIVNYFDIFLSQFLAQLTRKATHYNYESLVYLIKVIGGQFQSKINFVFVYGILIYALGIGILYIRKNYKYYLIFLIVLTIVFFSSESWYVVYLFPFLFLFLADKIVNEPKIRNISFVIVLMFILMIQLNVLIKLRKIKDPYQKEYLELINFIDYHIKDCKIIFLQMIPDPYFHLDKNKRYKEFAPYGLFASQYFSEFNQKRFETYSQIDCFVISNHEKKEPLLEKYIKTQSFEQIPFPKFSTLTSGILYKKIH